MLVFPYLVIGFKYYKNNNDFYVPENASRNIHGFTFFIFPRNCTGNPGNLKRIES